MPKLEKARRRDAKRQGEPRRRVKRSLQGVRASRQARTALINRYG